MLISFDSAGAPAAMSAALRQHTNRQHSDALFHHVLILVEKRGNHAMNAKENSHKYIKETGEISRS